MVKILLLPMMVVCSLPLAGCGGSAGSDGPRTSQELVLQPLVSGLSAPVFAGAAPGDASRLFIVEQNGTVRIFELPSGTLRPVAFLDLSTQIAAGSERGLLGLAFDPGYASNLRFYVFYTNAAGALVVARYQRNALDPDLAEPAGVILLTVPHPTFANHNGGMLAFGHDGCLYVATGDGGSGGDPGNNGQNSNSLLGKLLRIDGQAGTACANGISNPFALGGGAPEVWSLGLRNPWRFSFDRQTGDLYIGDVGQAEREEVNAVTGAHPGRGSNFGWRLMEGLRCFNPSSNCNPGGLVLPVIDYGQVEGACSVVGGYVYRGAAIPWLRGTYFYSDFCAGFVRSIRISNGQAVDATDWPLLRPPGAMVTSFGEDSVGELYLVSLSGSISKIVPR
jgi:glucose/arabinose dehydrogenase